MEIGQESRLTLNLYEARCLGYFDKFYTLRFLPQFLISVILACPESFLHSRTKKSEGFSPQRVDRGDPTSENDTEKKYSISDALHSLPQGSSSLEPYGSLL
jgi:hypothetical protein